MIPYSVGDVILGIVTSIKKYGVFLSFDNNYAGILHISEISSKYVSNIHKLFKIGDKVTTIILDVDENTKFLKVSLKAFEVNEAKQKKSRNLEDEISFDKLQKSLSSMIEKELERESKNEH